MQVFPSFIRYFKYGHFYGGIAQFIAGLIEYKGNTFGATAFTSYGMFWIALVGLLFCLQWD